MKKSLGIATALLLAVGSLGCMGAPVLPPLGIFYTQIDAPLFVGPGPTGSRRGEADVHSILGLVSWGDGSVKAAASNGGLSNVQRVDYEFFNVFVFYQRYTTVAHGN